MSILTFRAVGKPYAKFHNLERELEQRQKRMRVVLDCACALIEAYHGEDDFEDFCSQLRARILRGDTSIVRQARRLDAEYAGHHAQVHEKVTALRRQVEERFAVQAKELQAIILELEEAFISAFNMSMTTSTTASSELDRERMRINAVYSSAIATALAAGGSSADAGAREIPVADGRETITVLQSELIARQQRLDALQQENAQLKEGSPTQSEHHPEVRRLKALVGALQSSNRMLKMASAKAPHASSPSSSPADSSADPSADVAVAI
eukprot:g894.t1